MFFLQLHSRFDSHCLPLGWLWLPCWAGVVFLISDTYPGFPPSIQTTHLQWKQSTYKVQQSNLCFMCGPIRQKNTLQRTKNLTISLISSCTSAGSLEGTLDSILKSTLSSSWGWLSVCTSRYFFGMFVNLQWSIYECHILSCKLLNCHWSLNKIALTLQQPWGNRWIKFPWLKDGWMDGWNDKWMEGWTEKWTDGWMDGWTDKCMGSRSEKWMNTAIVILI